MTIFVKSGNLFEDAAQIYVNPVNCEGVMGRGIAKEFRKLYPRMFENYREKCLVGIYKPGRAYPWHNEHGNGPQVIMNVTTKNKWREPSQMEWVRKGLVEAMQYASQEGYRTLATPALGCGEGGLEWDAVQSMILDSVSRLSTVYRVDIFLYRPFDKG